MVHNQTFEIIDLDIQKYRSEKSQGKLWRSTSREVDFFQNAIQAFKSVKLQKGVNSNTYQGLYCPNVQRQLCTRSLYKLSYFFALFRLLSFSLEAILKTDLHDRLSEYFLSPYVMNANCGPCHLFEFMEIFYDVSLFEALSSGVEKSAAKVPTDC